MSADFESNITSIERIKQYRENEREVSKNYIN